MTAEEFKAWVKQMREYGIARSKAQCAKLLKKHPNSISNYCKRGCNESVASHCFRILHRLDKI